MGLRKIIRRYFGLTDIPNKLFVKVILIYKHKKIKLLISRPTFCSPTSRSRSRPTSSWCTACCTSCSAWNESRNASTKKEESKKCLLSLSRDLPFQVCHYWWQQSGDELWLQSRFFDRFMGLKRQNIFLFF